MICDPAQANDTLRSFFTLRRAHWPFTLTNTPYAWHWEATYPQPYGFTDDPGRPEQVNVSVAQNLRAKDGKVTNMSAGDARGRSFHRGQRDAAPDAVVHGHNAAEQWQRVFQLDPPFAMVTGWNEWIAGRWGKPGERPVFVDQFDQEHSRDIEPMRGGHGDNYYWQLVANVRRYKGAPPVPLAGAPRRTRIGGSFEAWRSVEPSYPDHLGETAPRDFSGAAGLAYTNRTGRNDIALCKTAHDSRSVFFYVRTREPLSSHTDPNWMWLLIDADQNPRTGWEGYEFIVNRSVAGPETTWLERHRSGWEWERVTPLKFRYAGHELHLAIPRNALGKTDAAKPLKLDFKWADAIQRPGDVMDFYLSGDVAPEGRFAYRFEAATGLRR
jgi:hypothetical protein